MIYLTDSVNDPVEHCSFFNPFNIGLKKTYGRGCLHFDTTDSLELLY